jgi:D-serine deaminase-like pyridoxal phosphate-dependent protein
LKDRSEIDMNQHILTDSSTLLSPSMIVFRDAMERNLQRMIATAGDVRRLRPHCKTHKMAAVTRIELGLGIAKHKCATFAEAEMLADAGVKDIFLAYNLVGPNIERAAKFVAKYPDVAFAVTADDERMIDALSAAMKEPRGRSPSASVGVLLDLDTGLHRTGVSDPARAAALYQRIAEAEGLRPLGFHVYDGQNHQTPIEDRRRAVLAGWDQARKLRDDFLARGWPVTKIVCGGTGSFPIFATLTDPEIELSPGTCVFHDTGYAAEFPEMDYEPAVMLLTRVISRPAADRLTCDLGNKAVASDPPKGQRVFFPALPDAEQVIHNEEHLVLETPNAARYEPGDVLLAIPKHVCPTSALHKWVYVAEGGRVVDKWDVTSRDRQITI